MNVGAQLRRARESRGLTIAALAATTRIQPKVLDALERNDLSCVPPQPYARGFVAAVARELGLDPDQTVREYFSQFVVEPPAVEPLPPVALEPEDRWRGWAPALGVVAVSLVIGLLLAGRAESPSAGEPGAVGTMGATEPTPEAAPAERDKTESSPGTRTPRASDVHLAAESVVVVLEADGPSWVAATVDGERQLYQILQPGAKHTLRGTREVTLRVGNAGAVRLSVNGRPPAHVGRPGEVRDLTFTPASSGS